MFLCQWFIQVLLHTYIQVGYSSLTVAGSLRVNYERYLYPYELFLVKNGKLEVRGCVSHSMEPSVMYNVTIELAPIITEVILHKLGDLYY